MDKAQAEGLVAEIREVVASDVKVEIEPTFDDARKWQVFLILKLGFM